MERVSGEHLTIEECERLAHRVRYAVSFSAEYAKNEHQAEYARWAEVALDRLLRAATSWARVNEKLFEENPEIDTEPLGEATP